MKDKNIFNHMDVGVNVGTMGIGIDVAMPVGDYVRIRAGYNYMPRFTINSDFNVETRSGGIGNLIKKVGRIDGREKLINIITLFRIMSKWAVRYAGH